MKKITLGLCTAVFMVLPVFAATQTEGKHFEYSLPERITKLKMEIARGEKIYTLEELKLMERKLKEDNQTMRVLSKPGR